MRLGSQCLHGVLPLKKLQLSQLVKGMLQYRQQSQSDAHNQHKHDSSAEREEGPQDRAPLIQPLH
jgi:hypothetical protein